jgi:CAAX prenyl protease-like protein
LSATRPASTETSAARSAPYPLWLAYVAPMAVFMGMTALLEPRFPAHYVWLYIAKVCIVTGALVAFRAAWQDIRFEAHVLLLAALVGLAVFAEWVLLDTVTPPLAFLGQRAAFNPFTAIAEPGLRGLFLVFRFFGLVLMVPVMEELFWRSFLLRYLTKEDFTSLPIGTFSASAFGIVAVAFGAAHPEWLAALVCAAAYGLLLRQTRSLFACIVAHAVTNLALGLYVLITHQWHFW